MKVSHGTDTTPHFTVEQLDYLKGVFGFKLSTSKVYRVEDINLAQGHLEVLNHIQNLITKQGR